MESFVGTHVRVLAPKLQLFWFSRYGSPGSREIKFRFAIEDYETVRSEIEVIEKAFAHGSEGCGIYDYVSDLGGGRFVAPDRKSAHQTQRALLVYEFLTAGARLFIDCLVQDGSGWKHEEEKVSFYNRITPLETFHHLFCNMTDVPTWASVLHYVHQDGRYMVVSDLESREIIKADPSIVLVGLHRIRH